MLALSFYKPPMFYSQKDCQNNWQENKGVRVNKYNTMVMNAIGPSFMNNYT